MTNVSEIMMARTAVRTCKTCKWHRVVTTGEEFADDHHVCINPQASAFAGAFNSVTGGTDNLYKNSCGSERRTGDCGSTGALWEQQTLRAWGANHPFLSILFGLWAVILCVGMTCSR